ncbi:TPA: SHOCT domain-containing protein, partial [Yersinia enterocolitica]|nr:SHOCT domain-containing protein [Yersinia enterocolitica]
FRDHELSGFYKAIWILFLLFIPLLTSLVYLITRGKGMAQRYRASVQKSVSETNEYIRHVAGKSPAEQIADAKKLLDEGTITESEYQQLKAKALS